MKALIVIPEKVLSAFSFIVCMMLFGASAGWAQQKAASMKDQLVGSWTLVSATNEQDGKKRDVFGSNPKGLLTFDRNGYFSVVFMRPELPKFASNNRMTGTPDENKAIVQGSIAYYGKYTVNEKDRMFTLQPEASTFPNWTGGDQKRLVTSLTANELRFTVPTTAIGGTNELVLTRAK